MKICVIIDRDGDIFRSDGISEARTKSDDLNERYPEDRPHIPVELEVPDDWFKKPEPLAGPSIRRLDR